MTLPKSTNTKVDKFWGGKDVLAEEKNYRGIIGSLMYVRTSTRPNIFFSTNVLSRLIEKLAVRHLNLAHRVLRYLASSCSFALSYRRLDNPQFEISIKGFVDLDFCGIEFKGESKSSEFSWKSNFAAVFVGGGLGFYRSKRRSIAAKSLTEVKLLSVSLAVSNY
jgi:hypothetical protein